MANLLGELAGIVSISRNLNFSIFGQINTFCLLWQYLEAGIAMSGLLL